MSKPPPKDDEDQTLFRQQMQDVQRLKHDRVTHSVKKPWPVARQTLADEQQVITDMMSDDIEAQDVEHGEYLLFKRAGIQHKVMKKLRQGRYRIDAELDLHGLTVNQAREALAQFLSECQQHNSRAVRIIHGKGLGSAHRGPVLKNSVNKWLPQRHEVLAFCSATPADGGTGAVYVLLKKS
ncbi:MAG TPA: DNA mismatch repair protein MutS [Gammaproteobacteria bacterium]|nr:DNA mismatch repair protein MutS [Gammaproteobacteria bacterium]